jgi:hypothetical protein
MNLIEVEPDKTKATEVVQRNEEPIAYRILGAFNPTKSLVAYVRASFLLVTSA